ncbi:MAG: hypothetical protein HLX50_00300 [Alteromonadaceae bacterium]|nr:hypothetical protein [Alteromonadaceae bacterium]
MEIRATYGGIFIGLGFSCLWFQQPVVYLVVGLAWLSAALSRALSGIVGKAFSSREIGGVVIEACIGMLLMTGIK